MSTDAPETAFAVQLRRYRLAAGLTQEELAERARLSERGINDLERGARRTPRRETVQLLADALALAGQERVLFASLARRGVIKEAASSAPVAPPSLGDLAELHLVGRAPERALVARHLAGEGHRCCC